MLTPWPEGLSAYAISLGFDDMKVAIATLVTTPPLLWIDPVVQNTVSPGQTGSITSTCVVGCAPLAFGGSWVAATFEFVVVGPLGAGTSVTPGFLAPGDGAFNAIGQPTADTSFSGGDASSVPEPSTALLVLVGSAGLAASRRMSSDAD